MWGAVVLGFSNDLPNQVYEGETLEAWGLLECALAYNLPEWEESNYNENHSINGPTWLSF